MREIVRKNFDCYSSFDLMLRDMLIDSRKEIEEKLKAMCDNYAYVIDTYGEIDDWWAPVSFVMQDELKLCVTLDIQPERITITVYRL